MEQGKGQGRELLHSDPSLLEGGSQPAGWVSSSGTTCQQHLAPENMWMLNLTEVHSAVSC